jgi:hypothetical protein
MKGYKKTLKNLSSQGSGAVAFEVYVEAWEERNDSPAKSEGYQTLLIDLLTDLRHYSVSMGLKFEQAVKMSEMHFYAEARGE